MPNIVVDVAIESDLWQAMPDIEDQTKKTVSQICMKLLPKSELTEVSILLTNDINIQKLNSDYRSKDKPTNVLSFPQTEEEELNGIHEYLILGDIIVSYERIKQEATDQKKTFNDHYTHMLVHGLLHLMHYDHITDEQARTMEDLEINILDGLGIKNPYEISSLYAILEQ